MNDEIEKPEPPMEGECCESGCSPCVWDRYYEQMTRWREAQKQKESSPDAG